MLAALKDLCVLFFFVVFFCDLPLKVSFSTCSLDFISVVLSDDRDVQLLAETRRARHLHQSGTAVSPLRNVPTVVQPPDHALLDAREAGHEVKARPMIMQGRGDNDFLSRVNGRRGE